ncbi:MAG TPA: FAD-binding oxidoreductase [Actinomycetales bacterium]|nr:FAD-binding oxidoreductase [Actinomycetales bacterium]
MSGSSGSRPMHWARWGDPRLAAPLTPAARGLVQQALGLPETDTREIPLADVRLPPVRLDGTMIARLGDVVGHDHVRTDDESRVRHTRGRSTTDLIRLRAGDAGDAPDAVVRPGSDDEVLALLSLCSNESVAVVPFGGGTSVVGGLTAEVGGHAGVVALDLARMDRLVRLDETSQTATLQAGVTGPRAEELLQRNGFTLGHFPQSFEYATIGGFAATRSSGQSSSGYGRFDDMVVGLTLVTPVGALRLGHAPASAAGPDLRQLTLGSEGAFGVITEVTLQVRPVPAQKRYEAWRLGSFTEGLDAVRALVQHGVAPTVLRLSDEAETAVGLSQPDTVGEIVGSGCQVVTGYEGSAEEVARSREATSQLLTRLGATPLGEAQGEAWAAHRFAGPYLRDSLLDAGALVETLETATYWSRLPEVYDAVRSSLVASLGQAIVLCHVSHVYATGASLYFTVATRQTDDPVGQWAEAKAAASGAVVRCGATITHHHGVGRDHRPYLAAEIGDLGVQLLRAVKERLDPAGVMNPGVLIP